MKMILTAASMKAADTYTIETIGVPSMVLMERAAAAMADAVLHHIKAHIPGGKSPKILAVCGSGNNGGDGFACARILSMKEYRTTVLSIGSGRLSPECEQQKHICENLGITILKDFPEGEKWDVIIDAVFGIGLSRTVDGSYASVIERINASGAWILSADIASGISADTGQVLGCAVKADCTVTMQYAKAGHLLSPGREMSGKLEIADIGIMMPANVSQTTVRTLEKKDLDWILPQRDPSGNKGTFGKVLVIAGSDGMAGASYLCAAGVLASGAGMVRILCPEENREILQILLPEAILSVYREPEEALALMRGAVSWADAFVIGPGLGTKPLTGQLLTELTAFHDGKPVVIDADGLNVMKGDPSLLKKFGAAAFITPHLMEMSRISGQEISELRAFPFRCAEDFSRQYGVTVLLKDARTVIASPSGSLYLNCTGNDGMATAGSGDVLAGILAGLLAQGTEVSYAGAAASFLHGCAGDAASRKCGKRSMTARDLIDGLKDILNEYESGAAHPGYEYKEGIRHE